jgi:hypothetical protein
VTDGPFAELEEVLASYAVLDCASHDRALEIARRIVDAIGDAVEVRPITGAGRSRRRSVLTLPGMIYAGHTEFGRYGPLSGHGCDCWATPSTSVQRGGWRERASG